MKNKLVLFSTIIIMAILCTLNTGAHDNLDYIFAADTFNKSNNGSGTDYVGMVYESSPNKVYAKFVPKSTTTQGSDNTSVQFGFPTSAKLKEYPIIKVGYKSYISTINTSAGCDINIGSNASRYWTSVKPVMKFNGEYDEVIIDSSTINGGDNGNSYSQISSDETYTYLRFKPWGGNSTPIVKTSSDDYFKVEYIALFKTVEEANEFTTVSSFAATTSVFDVKQSYRFRTGGGLTMNVETQLSPEYMSYLRFSPTAVADSYDNTLFDIEIAEFGNFSIKQKPVMAMKYRSNIKTSYGSIDVNLGLSHYKDAGKTRLWWGNKPQYISDGEFHTLIIDFSKINYSGGDGGYSVPTDGETVWDCVKDEAPDYVRFKPYRGGLMTPGEYFDVVHIGFFATEEEALNADFISADVDPDYAVRGDINLDGIVDIADDITLSRSLTDDSFIANNAGDLDQDGKISVSDSTKLSRHLANWTNYESLYISNADDAYIASLDAEFDRRKEWVLGLSSNWSKGSDSNKVYYVSNSGSDSNDGLSESTPWKTTNNLSSKLKSGDVVLFKRGDVWRRPDVNATALNYALKAVEGVTYSAYGSGAKPAFYGSYDAADPSLWEETSIPNVYEFKGRKFDNYNSDVGCIIFNHGEAYGARIITDKDGKMVAIGHDADTTNDVHDGLISNGLETWVRVPGEEFDHTKLSHDLEYYFDGYNSENPNYGKLYLYSEKGNPGSRFNSVELSMKGNVISGASNCVFDNLAVKYGASHGFGMGTVKNVTVRSCAVEWIGGAFQNYNTLTRFGNGIEIFGGCDGFYVYQNYVNQCFDCGITVQWQDSGTPLNDGQKIIQINALFDNNAVELCNSPLETWITSNSGVTENSFAFMNNVIYNDNLCRGSGYGFGGYIHQKTDNNMFYGGGSTRAVMSNCFIQNNKLWKARKYIIFALPTQTNYGRGFIWKDNIIVHDPDGIFGLLGLNLSHGNNGYTEYKYNDNFFKLSDIFEVLGKNTYMSYNFKGKN